MLLGALMVLAPGAGANHTQESPTPSIPDAPNALCGADPEGAPIGLGYDNEIGFGGFEGSLDDIDSDVVDGVSWDSYVVDGVRHFDWTSVTHSILAVIVKQANGAAIFSYEPDGAMSGTVYVDTGADKTGISHIDFCYDDEEQDEPDLTVEKLVVGTPDAGATFAVDVARDDSPVADDQAIAVGSPHVESGAGVYDIDEVQTGGADSTSWECFLGTSDQAFASGTGTSIDDVAVRADDVRCVFTNSYDDEPDITIVKAEVPDTNIPSNEVFTFDAPFQAQFTLSVDGTHTDADLEGTEGGYVYTEVEDVDYPLAYIECGDQTFEDIDSQEEQISALVAAEITGVYDDGDLRGVRIYPGDEDVTCTFFNEGDDTPPPPPPPEIPTPTFSVELEKLNDADNDSVFDDFETALAEGDDVEFEISIENTGTGALTLATLTDTFDGEVVDLLTEVDLDCVRSGSAVTLAVGSNLPVGSTTVCTFTLDGYAPAAGSTLENVVAIDTEQTGPVSDDSEVAVAEVLPEEVEPGSITIVKAVEGAVPTDGWAFGFNVSDGVGRAILTNTDADATFGQLDAGQYTIVEDANSFTSLKSIACDDPDAVSNGRTVTVDVSEGEDVTCTFTNVFPALAQADTEVKGDVITRTLPRTGDETRNLAGIGAFMLALGAAMVLGSKRQLASR